MPVPGAASGRLRSASLREDPSLSQDKTSLPTPIDTLLHEARGANATVKRIEAEKKLPDTLRIRIVERTPSALISRDGTFRYVDENGAAFADLAPSDRPE